MHFFFFFFLGFGCLAFRYLVFLFGGWVVYVFCFFFVFFKGRGTGLYPSRLNELHTNWSNEIEKKERYQFKSKGNEDGRGYR